MDVRIIAQTTSKDSLTITEYLACIANKCYTTYTYDEIINYKLKENRLDAKKIIENIIKSEHLSILEHYSFTFSITNVSVALLGQLTRHRLASFAAQSLRYNNLTKDENINIVIPEELNENINDINNIYYKSISDSYNNYTKLIEKGYKPQTARYVLPQGIETNLIMTMNIRELFHFFDLRYCNRADDEIYKLASMIYFLCHQQDEFLFSFAKHSCNECKNKCEKFGNRQKYQKK